MKKAHSSSLLQSCRLLKPKSETGLSSWNTCVSKFVYVHAFFLPKRSFVWHAELVRALMDYGYKLQWHSLSVLVKMTDQMYLFSTFQTWRVKLLRWENVRFTKCNIACRIQVFTVVAMNISIFLNMNVAQSIENQLIFQRKMMLPSSGLKSKPRKKLARSRQQANASAFSLGSYLIGIRFSLPEVKFMRYDAADIQNVWGYTPIFPLQGEDWSHKAK
jgi:hypothetical protein